MRMIDIIKKKRDYQELSKEEIEFFITKYTQGEVADYQAAAFVMAIYLNGMTKEETTNLALAMAYSGDVLDLSTLKETIVDKHSTGGVGDKVSLILLPLVSSLDVPVAKMSGRGLGFTGGTVDKLESIPGYQTQIEEKVFIENVKKLGISIISQTLNLAPADKKLYALRDSISCVESLPLIASSIMSKKIASGAQKIVLDVTVGKGAFMQEKERALQLAEEMISIGKMADRQTVCILTNMDEPLGYCVGNTLEVVEAVECLKGNMPEDVKQVVLELGAYMLKLAGKGNDIEENKRKLWEQIENKKAYEQFLKLVENQSGDSSYLKQPEKFTKANFIEPVYSQKEGYIQEINAKEVGKLAGILGAGREKKEDAIEPEVGIVLCKKVGDKISTNEILGYIHCNQETKVKDAIKKLQTIMVIEDQKKEKEKVLLGILS